LYDATRPDWVEFLQICNAGLSDQLVYEMAHPPAQSRARQLRLVRAFRRGTFGTVREIIAPAAPEFPEIFRAFGVEDMALLLAVDATFHGCCICVPIRARKFAPRTRHVWRQVAAHVTAGFRIRRTLAALTGSDPTRGAEAVLSSSGRVEHAVGVAQSLHARESIRNALIRIDAARAAHADDEVRAVELWTALFAGRWSLVEHFESDGRRYFLAFRNDPKVARSRSLTPRERQVVTYSAMGRSNKLIAYELGLSPSTVAKHLERARQKLGGRWTLEALAALPGGHAGLAD
jgi:DNA-binding CsgD family transcriptional regulator